MYRTLFNYAFAAVFAFYTQFNFEQTVIYEVPYVF